MIDIINPLLVDLPARIAALPPSAYLLNSGTWLVLTLFTLIACLNVASRGARLRWFWTYFAVQAFYLYKLKDVYTWVAIDRFPGFLIIKFVMHVSYTVLIEDAHVARPNGCWDFCKAYNVVSDPRDVGEGVMTRKYGEGKTIQEKTIVVKTEPEDDGANGTAYSSAIPAGVTTRSRTNTKDKRVSLDSGYSSLSVTPGEENVDPIGTHVEVTTYTDDVDDAPFIQASEFASFVRRFTSLYHSLSPKTQFLLTRTLHALIMHACIRSMDYLDYNISKYYLTPADYAPEKIHLLSRLGSVTAREILLRAYLATIFITYPTLAMAKYHSLLAITHVYLGISKHTEWPWLFGPITQATSQRAFWSGFWHRLFAAPSIKWARWSAVKLGIRHKDGRRKKGLLGLVYPLFLTFSIFLASGVMHAVVESRFVKCGYGADLWEPLLNWAGIVLEGVFQFGMDSVGPVKRFWERNPRVYRLCGYLWTGMFMMWCVPKVEFTRTNC